MRHMIGIAKHQLQRLPARRQLDHGFGLSLAEMQIMFVGDQVAVELVGAILTLA